MADIIPSSDYAHLYFTKLQKLQDVVNCAGLQVYWPELEGASSWRERWIAAGFAKNLDNFTVDDFENLVRCIPDDNDSDQWQANIEDLYFLKDLKLFSRFSTADARWDTFIFVLEYPPKQCWDVTVLDHRITRAISVLSYIAPIKERSLIFLDRLRPLCLENHSHAESKAPRRGWYFVDEKCGIWRNKALELQSAIVDFAEQHLPQDAILLPEDFTGMARSRWKLYHAQPHLQSLQEMVASFNARKSEETGIQNCTSRQKQLHQILRPEKWITLKFTTALRQKELRQILRLEKLARLEFSARGVKLNSLSTRKVGGFSPGNDALASAVSNALKVDKVGGATLTPTCELQLVSLQKNQSSSAMTPSSYPIQVEKPAFGTLDIDAPSPKRQCLLQASLSNPPRAPVLDDIIPSTLVKPPHSKETQNEAIDIWLNQLKPLSPNYMHQAQAWYATSEGDTEPSLVTSDTNGESTAQATKSKHIKVSASQLRVRRVWRKESEDGRLEHLKSILKTEPGKRLLKDTKDLQPVLQGLLQSSDVLKRTMFKYSTEEVWSQLKDTHLPSREDDEIPPPQPGHAISFMQQSFVGEGDLDPILLDLQKYISPNGDDRWFPFLFLEVVNGETDIEEAHLSNLHSASQALYNMSNLMEEKLLFEIRIFSIVLNADHNLSSVRAHRAVKLSTGALSFQFTELLDSTNTWNYACLVRAILIKYAVKELCPALESALVQIINQRRVAIPNL